MAALYARVPEKDCGCSPDAAVKVRVPFTVAAQCSASCGACPSQRRANASNPNKKESDLIAYDAMKDVIRAGRGKWGSGDVGSGEMGKWGSG